MSRALIIVDVQPTFCEGGELPVNGGNAVAQAIADYVQQNHESYQLIVTTQDWHIDPGDHFSDEPDFVDTWPPHGVAGTPNAELHGALNGIKKYIDASKSVKKGHYSAAYSGFEGVTEDDMCLAEILRDDLIEEVDVVGLAQSHCVCETAIDAAKEGYDVRVIDDLTKPVSPELGEAAEKRMRDAGVTIDKASPFK